MNEATFIGNLGLGDLILTAPIAVALLNAFDIVHFPCREQQRPSVSSFFSLHPRIKVYSVKVKSGVPVYQKEDIKGVEISPVFPFTPRNPDDSFAETFYAKLGLPYSIRWYCDPIPEAVANVPQLPVPDEDYTFLHHDPTRGYNIRPEFLKGLVIQPEPDESQSILRCANLIKHAKICRFIDSCFLHFGESVPTTGILEYHKYAKPLDDRWGIDVDVPSIKKWSVIY